MPGRTISSSAEVSVTLGSGGYNSPLTITAEGDIRPQVAGQPGLVSNSPTDFILNEGGIYGGLDGGNGVDLAGGGTLTNGGTICAGYGYDSVGVGVSLSTGTVTNTGLIQGGYGADDGQNGGDGIIILGDSNVTNQGSIAGGYGSSIGGTGAYVGGGFLYNTGHITGGGGEGGGGEGAFVTGGTLLNKGAVIGGQNEPGMPAIGIELTGGSLINVGFIAGGTAVVDLGGALTNASTGTIDGFGLFNLPAIGVSLPNGGTVINAGRISGSNGGDAILFGVKPSRLILQPGAVFSGAVVANVEPRFGPGYTYENVMELAAGSGAGTLSGGIGYEYQGFDTISVDSGADWTISGFNTIAFSESLFAHGTLYNAGTIIGAAGTYSSDRSAPGAAIYVVVGGSLNNAGVILGGENQDTSVLERAYGQDGTGIILAGGSAINTGTIAGGQLGVGRHGGGAGAYLSSGTMFNAGMIMGGAGGAYKGGDGVEVFSYATLTNTGFIAGGDTNLDGIPGAGLVNDHGTVYNNGTIVSGSDVLGANAGIGLLSRGSQADVGVGVVVNNGLIYGSFGTSSGGIGVEIDGGTLINAGTIIGTGAGGVVGVDQYAIKFTGPENPDNFFPDSVLIIDPGAVFVGTVSSYRYTHNTIELAAGASHDIGTLDMGGTFIGLSTIQFDSSAPWLLEGNSISLADGQAISNFNDGDTIELEGFTATSDSFVAGSGLILGNGIANETLGFTGNFTNESFTVTDVALGTEILLCYLRGTKISTPAGELPVEALRIGDELVTFFSGVQKIKWIGRQTFKARFVQNSRDRLPVRIAAGALGRGLPKRDLSISPGHSMFLGGRLVLAKSLINGITITQGPTTEDINYYLIEFETHDCVQAEGVWSESFADGPGLRNAFHNAAEFFALYPRYQTPAALQLCAPRPEHGPALAAALRPIVRRATACTAPGRLRGYIDIISARRIEGWAQDQNNPELPVLLEVLADNRVIGTVLACDYRADLAATGIGQGRCHFAFQAPAKYAGTDIHVRRAADGAALTMSEDCQNHPVGKRAAGG
jgi:hypothetical protein